MFGVEEPGARVRCLALVTHWPASSLATTTRRGPPKFLASRSLRWAVCHICSITRQCRVDKSEALFMGLNEQRYTNRTAMVAKGQAPRDVACSHG
jgi:hypothetical protein